MSRLSTSKPEPGHLLNARRRRDLPALRAAAIDRAETYRSFAIYSLGNLGDAEARPLLFDLMTSADNEIRVAAITALVQLGNAADRQRFIGYLSAEDVELVRWKAYGGVALSHSEEAADALERGLKQESKWIGRLAAAIHLRRVGGERAASALSSAARQERNPLHRLRLLRLANAARRDKTAHKGAHRPE